MATISITVGAGEYGMNISKVERGARDTVYATEIDRIVSEAFPAAIVAVSVDSRTDAPMKVIVNLEDGDPASLEAQMLSAVDDACVRAYEVALAANV